MSVSVTMSWLIALKESKTAKIPGIRVFIFMTEK
jgi:hypothetical protein